MNNTSSLIIDLNYNTSTFKYKKTSKTKKYVFESISIRDEISIKVKT